MCNSKSWVSGSRWCHGVFVGTAKLYIVIAFKLSISTQLSYVDYTLHVDLCVYVASFNPYYVSFGFRWLLQKLVTYTKPNSCSSQDIFQCKVDT